MCIESARYPPSAHGVKEECRNTFRFKDLVFDVQIYIISCFISTRDLKSLSVVSHHFNSLAIPALYADVRLVYGLHPPPWRSITFTETLISAQQDFTFQFLTHLERTQHVRILTWQFCSALSPTFTGLFPLLDNLRRVHLINPHPTHMNDLDTVVPHLFPRIKEIKITGTTLLSFVLPLFHSPQHLTDLSFDIIQPHATALGLLTWVLRAGLPCLRSLSLRALDRRSNAQPWDVSREKELFSVWREMLLAVRLSVESITLGFRIDCLAKDCSASPSTERFAQTVLHVFLERRWPKLKSLLFEGIDIHAISTADHAAQLDAAAAKVFVVPEAHAIPRFWNSEPTDNF